MLASTPLRSVRLELHSALCAIRAVLDLQPQRLVRTRPQIGSWVVAASDAAQHAFRVGTEEQLGSVIPIDGVLMVL